jgi:hypothetical protein
MYECRQNGDVVAAVVVRLKDNAVSNEISEVDSELMHHFKCTGE